MVEHQIRFDDNCTRIRSSLARSWSRLGRNRERGRDSQGCDEDHGGKCAKALKAGHWTVTSKRKGPPRVSGTHTSRVRRLSSITREPWRKVIGALGQRWHAAT